MHNFIDKKKLQSRRKNCCGNTVVPSEMILNDHFNVFFPNKIKIKQHGTNNNLCCDLHPNSI